MRSLTLVEPGMHNLGVIESPHHFPQWRVDEFNPLLSAFLEESESKGRR